ncbi:MAG: peroxiredoxin [Saprospiraceae bacterium]
MKNKFGMNNTKFSVNNSSQRSSGSTKSGFKNKMEIHLSRSIKYLGVVFLTLFVASQIFGQKKSAIQVAQKSTLIGGAITEPTEGTIQVHVVENYITRQEKIYQIPLSEVGEFRFEFPMEKTTVMRVSHSGQDLDVYLEPGDAIKILSQGENLRETVAFEGKAALHNEYLNESALVFENYSDNVISEAIIQRNSLNFRRYMDRIRSKKKRFLEDFTAQKEGQFSKEFSAYAKTAIDYWWTYHLMRYRTEHPAGNNLSIPMTLPSEYYDFLREIELSNDAALINQDYLYFLDLFLDFAKENPREWQEISQGTDKLVVKNTSVILLNEHKIIPVTLNIDKGKTLHIVDDRLLNAEKINPDNFYKVEAYSGLTGWISGADITYSNQSPVQDDDEFTQTREVESSYMEPYILGRFHRTEIRELPHEEKVLGHLLEGEEAEFLLNQTTEKFRYRHFGALYTDYWYQIRTKSGISGWVFRGGVEMRERKITTRETKKIILRMNNVAAKANLNGQTLFYALAKDLYQRANVEEQGQLKTDVFNFLRFNPIDDYGLTVQRAYENALRRRAGMKTTDYSQKEIIKISPPPSDAPIVANKKRPVRTTVPKTVKSISTRDLPEIDNLPQNIEETVVSVKGKIFNSNGRKVKLTLFLDPILYKEDNREIKPNIDGTFSTDFSMTQGVSGEISYGNKFIEIFLEPGDDLSFSFDASDMAKTIVYSGRGQNNNNYLKEMAIVFASQDEELRAKLQYANPKEFSDYLAREVKVRKQFSDKYCKKIKLSEAFLPVAKTNITYWRASNLLNYPYEHPLYNNQPAPMPVAASYYDFLEELDINETGGLPAKNYIYFLQQYLDYLVLQPENKGKTQIETAQKYLKDEAYYFTVAKLLNSACRRGNLAEAGKAIQTFITECPYDLYNNVLRFAYNEAKGLVIGTKAPDFELTDINGNTIRLSDFEGKVVYMDFWATWCAPCRRYLPHSQDLPDNFPKDEVVFLYISLDDNKTDWENYVKSHGLHGTHVCAKAGHGYHSKIAELYKVKSLPAYFLIDQNGRIAESPAANPASSKITEQIRALLMR